MSEKNIEGFIKFGEETYRLERVDEPIVADFEPGSYPSVNEPVPDSIDISFTEGAEEVERWKKPHEVLVELLDESGWELVGETAGFSRAYAKMGHGAFIPMDEELPDYLRALIIAKNTFDMVESEEKEVIK